jgi:hypothetical protein
VHSDSTNPHASRIRRFRSYFKLAIPGLSASLSLSLFWSRFNLFTASPIHTSNITHTGSHTPYRYSILLHNPLFHSTSIKTSIKNGFSYSQRKSQTPENIDVTRGTGWHRRIDHSGEEVDDIAMD